MYLKYTEITDTAFLIQLAFFSINYLIIVLKVQIQS